MLYDVTVRYSGDYRTEVNADSEEEAKKLATEEFYSLDTYPELWIDDYDILELEEEEE